MTADIERVHDCLDKSEKVIDKMTKPVYVRMFSRAKRPGKGLDKQKKLGRKEAKERDALRDGGVDSLDLDGLRERDEAARELTYQEGLVSTVNEYTLETSRRTKANADKVKTMLK
eukprot:contig_36028_g8593